MGILFTLPSSTFVLFSSDNTTLDRIMTETEISIMGSLSSASPMIVMPFCGYVLDKIGRKRCLMLFTLPQVLGWMLLVIFNKVEAVICSMFMCGLSGPLYLVAPVYINEYCEKSIRGSMTTYVLISYIVGTMVSYLMGGFLEYRAIAYSGLSISIFGLAIECFMKESPINLMMKGREEEAAEAVAFFKSCDVNSKEVIEEIGNIRRIISLDIEKIEAIPEEEKLRPQENKNDKLSVWKYLIVSRSTRRALVISMLLFVTCLSQGGVIVQMFAEPLFKVAVPNISATLASVLFALVSIAAGLYAAHLVERVGRRMLVIVASLLNGFCCAVLGTQLHFLWGPGWLTVVFMLVYAVNYTLGAGTIPNILVGEIFLPEIKSLATTFCTEWLFFVSFILLYIFPLLLNKIGLGLIFFIFSGFSFASTIFSFIYVPETKGIEVDEIQRRFLKIK
ncbi:facilitated trehalose transporter Tret1-like isoform X2 [Danaus plexippus]|nr:facilitated trehalose transporter Tret1-like isoform X2 [Danaus plexippus]